MTLKTLGRAGLLRSMSLMLYIGVALSAAMIGIVVFALRDTRLVARRQADQQAQNVVLNLDQAIGRLFTDMDLGLQSAVRGMSFPGVDALPPAMRQAILFDGAIAAQGFSGIAITDATGNIIYESKGAVQTPINLSDRDYFKQQASGAGPGLGISGPLRSRNEGTWTIGLVRSISAPDGGFRGVAVGGLRIDYISLLFQSLKLGPLGNVALFTADGVLIAEQIVREGRIGHDVTRADVFRHFAESPSGTFISDTSPDGVERLYHYRQIGALPFVISVGIATQDIYADWTRKAAVIGGALCILILVGVGLALTLRAELRRRALAEYATTRSRYEHATSLAQMKALFDNSPDAMFMVRIGSGDRFIYESVNVVWLGLMGLGSEDALGHTPHGCHAFELAEMMLGHWQRCLDRKEPCRYGFILPQSGSSREWEAVVVPVLGNDGRIRRLVGVARDLTDRNRLEAKLRQAQRMEAFGQLTAGVAHDFNNLLQAILGSLEMLRDQSGLNQDSRDCAAVAEDAARRGAALTHRLLAFSRKQMLTPILLQPQALIADLTAQLQRTLAGRVRVAHQIDEATWLVCVDGHQLHECLVNLAMNAHDAMPGGGTLYLRAVNVSPAEAEQAGMAAHEYVRFEVEDEGTGMAEDTLSRALEPFFTTKEVGQGTGLGLSMVEGFARQSGGDLRIRSRLHEGTTVSLWLPRAIPDAVAQTTRPLIGPAHERPHILVTDDEANIRQLLTWFLSKAGFAVTSVQSGEAALEQLRGPQPFALLVTDQSMPGITGCELIAAAGQIRPQMPTMLITGYDKVSGLDQLDGRVTVLRKPFERAAFLRQVHALIGANDATIRPREAGEAASNIVRFGA
ncbi:ATP-binding protein [Acidisphaera sp. L21]|uniref:ATP-binding protein n=1 Tax=Acidisphaera sp. L21 TaxID=1641851 RepID=UPI00131E5BEF|nr:ATP-binding protein [Acidisphaera sp. L21]